MKIFYTAAITLIVILLFEHFLIRHVNRRLLAIKAANGPTANVSLAPTLSETIRFALDSSATTLSAKDY
jgi:hypothetical protein